MTQRNLPCNTVSLQDAINSGARRARALARVLQTAATSNTGVEDHDLAEVADIIVSELDKVIDAKDGVYQALPGARALKFGKRRQ